MATISKSLTVAAKSAYSLTINVIPTGSSITPANDIQIWLHCADIWDKTYTTISQVLADASTLFALISSNNAADYMARSTNWASSVCANQTAMGYIGNNDYCANKLLANSTWLNAICNSTYMESVLNVKVPTMTSATAPSGVVTQSSTYSGAGYMAFDGNDTTGWVPTYVGSKADYSDWLGYEFTSNVLIKCVKLLVDSGSFNVSACKYKLQQYNGSTWIDVGSAGTISQNAQIKNYTLPCSGGNKLKKYRVIFDSLYVSGQYQAYIRTMQLYGRA